MLGFIAELELIYMNQAVHYIMSLASRRRQILFYHIQSYSVLYSET